MVAPPMTQSLMVSATGVHQSAVFKLLPSAFHRACIHFACGMIVSLGVVHTPAGACLRCRHSRNAGLPCMRLVSEQCQTAGGSDNHKIMCASFETGIRNKDNLRTSQCGHMTRACCHVGRSPRHSSCDCERSLAHRLRATTHSVQSIS